MPPINFDSYQKWRLSTHSLPGFAWQLLLVAAVAISEKTGKFRHWATINLVAKLLLMYLIFSAQLHNGYMKDWSYPSKTDTST